MAQAPQPKPSRYPSDHDSFWLTPRETDFGLPGQPAGAGGLRTKGALVHAPPARCTARAPHCTARHPAGGFDRTHPWFVMTVSPHFEFKNGKIGSASV